jgi:ribonuclease HII
MARSDSAPLYEFDAAIERAAGGRIIGCDEAGRGPLAGPVVAAAVMLDPASPVAGVDDSKKLTPRMREALYDRITVGAAAWAVGVATVEEIDRHNILAASLMAMQRALDKVDASWSLVLVDGNQRIPSLEHERQRPVVKGDQKSAAVAAASIVAKVTRDRLMSECHEQYPNYGFLLHKGYGTALHRQRIQEFGLCPLHRKTFCRNAWAQTSMSFSKKEIE